MARRIAVSTSRALSIDPMATVQITIFAPNFVPNGSKIAVTFFPDRRQSSNGSDNGAESLKVVVY